jgi:hypothetical protein
MHHRLEDRPISVCVMIFALLFIFSAIASGGQMAVIELKHRPADDVIPVISPFLGPGDSLSGQDSLLFLNTTPENLTRIRSIIAGSCSSHSRQLAITVGQGDNAIDQLRWVDLLPAVLPSAMASPAVCDNQPPGSFARRHPKQAAHEAQQ